MPTNGWQPRDGQEWFTDVQRRLRLIERHRHDGMGVLTSEPINASLGDDLAGDGTVPVIGPPMDTDPIPATPGEVYVPSDEDSGGFIPTCCGSIVGQLTIYSTVPFEMPVGAFIDTGTNLRWNPLVQVVHGDTSWLNPIDPTSYAFNLEQGWYHIVTGVQLFWNSLADAGDGFRLYRNGTYDDPPLDGATWPVTRVSPTLWGCSIHVDSGPGYIQEDVWYEMRSEAKAPAAVPSYSNIYATITRYV